MNLAKLCLHYSDSKHSLLNEEERAIFEDIETKINRFKTLTNIVGGHVRVHDSVLIGCDRLIRVLGYCTSMSFLYRNTEEPKLKELIKSKFIPTEDIKKFVKVHARHLNAIVEKLEVYYALNVIKLNTNGRKQTCTNFAL